MIPSPELLQRLIKANTSFLLYGQKASGKTKLIHSLFEKGQTKYIEINCTLTSKKQNFLWLFNVELRRYLKQQGVKIEALGQPVNLDSWINEMKRLVSQKKQIEGLLDNLYIFMDNIEEMLFQQSFIPCFYNACQKEFTFRFSFVFCGLNFMRKEYTLELPFRTMISFCMPKPVSDFNFIIQETVQDILRQKFSSKLQEGQVQKATKSLTQQIKAAFQDIESNLEKLRSIAKVITQAVIELLDPKQIAKSLMGIIHRSELKKIIQQVVEHGPLQDNLMKHKIHAVDGDQSHELCPNLQYYPQLILASIHMADYYPEKEDKRRFQDYKGRTNARNKDLKKSDFKVGKHNLNRIIAISQALQSQARENDKEYPLQHHTLDYYSTFENLKNENRLKFYGNKVTGIVKQEQAKAFISKCDLRYEQFMSG